MKEKSINNLTIYVILTLVFSILRYFNQYENYSSTSMFSMSFILQSAISMGIIFYFAITVSKRIMNKNIKSYLYSVSILSILWLLIRDLKWRGFQYLETESRFMWYLFYIPILLIPFFCLLIAIYMGKKESYRINKKCYLLSIPIILFIILVLTNDIHQQFFIFKQNFINWDEEYSYNYGYFIMLSYIISLIVAGTTILVKKWRIVNKNKQKYKIYAILGVAVIYITAYLINRNSVSSFLDLTTFCCFLLVFFWEVLIQIGLISSNQKHEMFFEKAKINAQILDDSGKRIIPIKSSINITENNFIKLKKKNTLQINKKILLQMKTIENGYVVWSKDISKNIEMNNEIKAINSELYNEIDILKEQTLLEKERSKVKKLNNIYNLINEEIEIPKKELSKRINEVKKADEAKQNTILKEINIISCYIKRKVNLLLKIDNNKHILNEDMISCYNESLRGLGIFNISSHIKYNLPISTPPDIHILFYDMFEKIIEKAEFNINMVLINCNYYDDIVRYSLSISKNKNMNIKKLEEILSNEMKMQNYSVIIEENEESLEIIFKVKKEGLK